MSRKRRRKGNNQVEIPGIVEDFAYTTYKAYKKENKEYFDSKKELKADYFSFMVYALSDVIDFLLRKGHLQQKEIQDIKNACYGKIVGEEGEPLIEYMIEDISQHGIKSLGNIKLFPIILHQIISDILKFNAQQEASEDPEKKMLPPDRLIELSETILRKRLKKAAKAGIPDNLAFDLLGVVPCDEALDYAPFFRARMVFDVLYQYAAVQVVDFGKAIEFLFPEELYSVVIGYALQERKDKYKNFNETQRKLFNDINTWVFDTLESMTKEEINDILVNYVKVRKNDAAQGKDSNRRYFIGSLPDSVYPRIYKVVQRMKEKDAELAKYL